eukprot:scaffold897_cov70-Skeletonema_dohrnii-CCMP3373.AAC.1
MHIRSFWGRRGDDGAVFSDDDGSGSPKKEECSALASWNACGRILCGCSSAMMIIIMTVYATQAATSSRTNVQPQRYEAGIALI